MNHKDREVCPVSTLMSLLSGSWTLYILWVFCNKGAVRFGVLKREIENISTKVLTERLRMLETENIVYREYKPTIPPEVTYGLTERGRELMDIIHQLDGVAKLWYGQPRTALGEREIS
jgi:DNA-binding HxlR family transcriptional regulator